ncbi:hypothetical protein [Marinospirillum insulare]|uniref:Uncharacterized protein n=1 Tax=Marinospirillum insulare TaxID=217169 RepID=A0ABQ6A0E1_9GAMM|nr:hypothetical protein [Marinospirillum insulare]GLR65048.1 hypothetical protein GCM10007878_24870 [Marinospirillum insulare]
MFYMITWGDPQIEEAYVGTSPQDAIQKARPLIDQWPEYKVLETEEMLEMLLEESCEFDIVKIKNKWLGYDLPIEKMIDLYENRSVLLN